jgi:peroxiredoxin Q/BCP
MKSLKIGDLAPDFTTVDHLGKPLHLKQFRGQKVILFTYPKALTPGCTAEACSLENHYSTLSSKGFNLIGLSADSADLQKRFAEKYQFSFALIPDTEKIILKSYGAWGPKKMYGREYEGILRTTFIIDEEGRIEHIFDKVRTKDHAQQILELYK